MVYKAVKLEVYVLVDMSESNAEIIATVQDAAKDYCAFYESFTKVVEVHENVVALTEDRQVDA